MHYTEILVLLCCGLGVIGYFYFVRPYSTGAVDAAVRRFWADEGYCNIEVYQFTTTEKLRYGIAVIPWSFRHSNTFSFHNPKEEKHYRKLEMVDGEGKKQTVFAEASFKGSSLIECVVLDRYNI